MSAEVDLTGAIDMHVHFGPDPGRNRRVTALEAIEQATAAGHAGLVLKSHDAPTANVAAALGSLSAVRVIGSVCCDLPIGGLNPGAVENALQIGAGVVWLPTMTSAQDWERHGRHRNVPHPGVEVVRDGRLVPEAEEIMRLTAEHDAVLATGHVSIEEHLAVAAAMPAGAKLLVTHALETLCGPGRDMTVPILEELVASGAMVELCALTCVGALASRPVEEIASVIGVLGAEHCVIASDFGQEANDLPTIGLQRFAEALVSAGVGLDAITTMAVDNPTRLVGGAPTGRTTSEETR